MVRNMVDVLLQKFIQPYSAKVEELKKENSELRSKLESAEVNSCLDNLILHGIPESQPEVVTSDSEGVKSDYPPAETHLRTQEFVAKFCNDNLKIPVTASDISIAHRLPRGKFDKHRPIIVRFTSLRILEKI